MSARDASVEAAVGADATGDRPPGTPGWWTVAEQECRDLWLGGRGPLLVFVFSLLLSVVTYLTATNQALNFLEVREAVNLTVQVALAVGALMTLVVSADAVSGERERGTLETLLLSPVPRRHIVLGKWIAALSLWLALLATTTPYVWVLGRGVSVAAQAVVLDLTVGTLLAAALASAGLVVSGLAGSNKVSLSACLFVLLALFAPTQLPTGVQRGWFGDVLLRLNPVASAERYISDILVGAHHWTTGLTYLLSPVLCAALAGTALAAGSDWLVQLEPRARR